MARAPEPAEGQFDAAARAVAVDEDLAAQARATRVARIASRVHTATRP